MILATAPTGAMAQSPSCRLEVVAIDFGVYNPLHTERDDAAGSVTVACTPAGDVTPVTRLTVTSGQSGRYLERRMSGAGGSLRYNIFADATHRRVLGDGTGGSVTFGPPSRSAAGRSVWRIYGEIPAGQMVPKGGYTDALLIEVAF